MSRATTDEPGSKGEDESGADAGKQPTPDDAAAAAGAAAKGTAGEEGRARAASIIMRPRLPGGGDAQESKRVRKKARKGKQKKKGKK